MSKKIGITLGVITLVAALVICLAPLKGVAYTVTVDYEDTETYYVDEPYEELQDVTEALKYQYLGFGSGGYTKLDGNYVCGPHYKLMNRAEVAGHFTLRLTLYSIEKDKYLDLQWEYPHGFPEEVIESEFEKLIVEKVLYLEPGEIGEAAWSLKELIGKDCTEIEHSEDWKVLPEEIVKQKMITKYRQVEKQRTVTKQRQETRYKKVTLLDYLLHY